MGTYSLFDMTRLRKEGTDVSFKGQGLTGRLQRVQDSAKIRRSAATT